MSEVSETLSESLHKAASALRDAQRLLVGTGAGMSADSGIPTYRNAGETGWRRYGELEGIGLLAEDLSCPAAFESNPNQAWGFWEANRRKCGLSGPHIGYHCLNQIAALSPDRYLQTTNVDGFHIRSGWPSDNLIELHGSLWRLQHCSHVWEEWRTPLCDFDPETYSSLKRPECPQCGGVPRPNILMFADLEYRGDAIKEQRRRDFHASQPDVFLVIGESGAIPTHAYDAKKMKEKQELIVIDINPFSDTKVGKFADIQIKLGAAEALSRLHALIFS